MALCHAGDDGQGVEEIDMDQVVKEGTRPKTEIFSVSLLSGFSVKARKSRAGPIVIRI
jgi:hypothetical protein